MEKEILNTIKEKYFLSKQLIDEYNSIGAARLINAYTSPDPSEADITYISWLKKEISDIDDFFRHLPDTQGLD